MSGKNSIQVAIKVRPLLKKEKDQQWRIVDNSIQLIDSQTEPYYFDHIFDQNANNQIIFDKMAKQIVHSAIQGFNGTIFAYGQTSSGKTYTMMGDENNPGVMVLTAKEIFKEIERTQDRQFLLRVGYIEIYNEKIYDLLNKKNQDLKIHDSSTGIVNVNCEECIIRSEDDLLNHLNKGNKERTVGETNMNERSSRSHAIFRIIIESRKIDRSQEDDAVIQSVINLVDLAGSERADQTGATGTRLKEGGHINKSLLFLSNVIKRLSENEDDKYISYRDSKLTRILQASLGGNALTAIICTIKPNAIEETQSTLNFALRAKTIKNKPQVNEIVSDATMMKRLEHEIKVLKSRLEEEQLKNKNQFTVRVLEERIKNEDLKIISCNSLLLIRNREKRRRTWCPSSTNLDTSISSQQPSALPVSTSNTKLPSNLPQLSRIQAPKASKLNTPLITMRPPQDLPSAANLPCELPKPPDNLPDIDEEFAPAELVNFEMLSPLPTPRNKQNLRNFSITPKISACPQSTLEQIEHDLLELQSFTNLENKTEVQHEPYLALKQKVETLSQRNAFLENERLEYLQLKDEIINAMENLTESQKRCHELQVQVEKLTDSIKKADQQAAKYEAELAELKKTNEKLEMENRDAVNLEFEFKRHKNKSKVRETELLEALSEKEKEIAKLEKSLSAITAERLQNTKEELLQKSFDECQADENGRVCIKCEDLQRLLEENKKITLEFEKLTLEYENLKLNYTEIDKENEAYKLKISQLETIQEKERCESEKLLEDIQQLRLKLQNVQEDFEQLSTKNSSKNEECQALSRQIELAREEMVLLEEKFKTLETSWQEQQQTLSDIETQYANIQIKYEQLQSQYDQLEVTRGQSATDCQRLEKENVELQTEIEDLKRKVQDAQQKLLECNEKSEVSRKEVAVSNEKSLSENSKIQEENETLKNQLLEIQTQYDDLQKEYDTLSNQLMDILQESESLKNENTKIQEKLMEYELINKELFKADVESNELKSQLVKVLSSENKPVLRTPSPCRTSSMRSSGVCMAGYDDEEFQQYAEDMHKKFCELSESLTEIELEHTKGKTKVFKSASKNSTPNYKMYLKNILGVRKIQKEFDMEIDNIHLQGFFEQHSFHIVELCNEMECDTIDNIGCDNVTEYIEKLKQEIIDLKSFNEQERLSNKSMLESTERAFIEMREQIQQLSAELLEKSVFVENCACKTYQQQIETLEKQKADITIICEELQGKVNATLNDSINNLANSTREQDLMDSYDSQTKMLEDLTQRCLDMEIDLQTAREQMANQEKEYQEKCNQLKLEFLNKLEISANEYRDNMKKYNKEWEYKKEEYEEIIKDLRDQIKQLKLQTPYNNETKQVVNGNGKNDDSDNETLSNQENKTNDNRENEHEEAKHSLEWKLHSLEKQLEMIKEENSQYKNEIPLLDSKIFTLEKQLKSEKASLEAQVKKLKDDLKCAQQLSNKQQELDEKFKELDNEYAHAQEKLRKAEIQIEELQTEILNREKLINNLQNKLETIEEEKESIANEVEVLKKQCAQLQDSLISLQVKEQNILRENEELKQEKSTLQEEYENFTANQSELLLQKYALEDKLQHITTEMNLQKADSEILQSQAKELKEENATLLHKNSLLQAEKCALEEELKCQKEKAQSEVSLEQVIKEKAEISQNLHLITENIESLQKELKQKEEDIRKAKEDKDDIEKDLHSLRVSLSETIEEKQRQLLETEKDKEKIKQDSIKISHDMKALQDELSKLTYEKSEQQLELEKMKQNQKDLESIKKSLSEKQQDFASLEDSYQLLKKENQSLQAKVHDLSAALTSSKEAKEQQLKEIDKLRQEHSVAKGSHAALKTELQELQQQLENFENLKEEKSKLETTLNKLKSSQTNTICTLQKERDNLQNTVEQYKQHIREFKEKEETLTQKIETLNQQLHEFRRNTQSYENLLVEHKEVESALTNANNVNQKLQEEINKLSSEQENYASTIKSLSGKIEIFNLQHDKHLNEKRQLETKLSHLKDTLQDEKSLLQREHQQLKSSLDELQLKYDSLQTTNTQLQNSNHQLQQQIKEISDKLQDFNKLQKECNALKIQNIELQHTLKATVDEASRCSLSLREEIEQHKLTVEKQQDDFNKIKNEMETKYLSLKEENQQLSSSITALRDEKQTLDNKLREITVRNFERDLHRQVNDAAANTSLDSDKSYSPRERRSLDRMCGRGGEIKSANTSIEDKLSVMQHLQNLTAERKNRRLSTHDERRRQSSYWGVVYDKETMTDPVDTNCKCLELDSKLKECERNLFIKNSQVTALNMQLKNHPLKDENAVLIKRLQEEQDKHRFEIKRLKNKLYEQTVKTEKALAAAALATEKTTNTATTAAEVDHNSSTKVIPQVLTDVEVQTDDELSASIQKLQGKYNDLKKVCRYRYNVIKELEEKLAPNENANGNSLSALEAANYKVLNNQCESLKKELNTVKEKYEYAKRVLHLRREEIQKLHSQQSEKAE